MDGNVQPLASVAPVEAAGASPGARRLRDGAQVALDHAGWGAAALAAAWLTALLLAVWPAWRNPSFVSNSNVDSAFFGYAGELVRQGGTPYVTFWDHKPPLIYLIDAAALSLSGGAVWGLWVASLATLLASLALAHAAMRRPFGPFGTLLGITVFAFTLPQMLSSNLTEEYALPLQWGSALLLVRWSAPASPARSASPRRHLLFGLALGVLGALGFALKANLIGSMVSVALAATIVLLLERRVADWARVVAGGMVGAVLVCGAIVAYVASRGALQPFMDQVFHYNFVYAGATWGLRIRAMLAGISVATQYSSLAVPFAAWVVALFTVVRDGVRRPSSERGAWFTVRVFAVVWLPIEAVLASVSGRPYTHYFIALLPPLAFLAALFGCELAGRAPRIGDADGRRTRSGPLLVAAMAGAIALLCTVNIGLRLRDTSGVADVGALRSAQVRETAAYVRERSPADMPLLVWGHASDVYFFSGRRPASRFVYTLPLLTPGYADSALVQGFIAEVSAASPEFIVDATAGQPKAERLVPGLSQWSPDWTYPDDQGPNLRWWSMTPALRGFYDYVAANYAVVDTVGPQRWLVFQRRTPRSP